VTVPLIEPPRGSTIAMPATLAVPTFTRVAADGSGLERPAV